MGEAGIGCVLASGFYLPPNMLTPDEIEAILVCMHFVRNLGDASLARAADDVVAKVARYCRLRCGPCCSRGRFTHRHLKRAMPANLSPWPPLRAAIRKELRNTTDYADAQGK